MDETGRTELQRLLTEQLPATRTDPDAGSRMLDQAGRCVYGDPLPPPEPDGNKAALALLDRMAAALQKPQGSIEAAAEILEAAESILQPVKRWEGQPQPRPILWRAPNPKEDARINPDCVLSAGEVALLSGAGGVGKSSVTLTLATAATTLPHGAPYGAACGLRVTPGPVVLVSYEDSPVRVAYRLALMSNDIIPETVHLWPDPMPLWVADPDNGQSKAGPNWSRLWRQVGRLKARLVVVDPASAALADVSTSEGGPVRAFMRALAQEAEVSGVGVLVVTHDTKAARNEAQTGGDPGAGAVAGSATWFDAARGVLHMKLHPLDRNLRLIQCLKANYGRALWGAALAEHFDSNSRFAGLKSQESMTAKEMDDLAREAKTQAQQQKQGGKTKSEGGRKDIGGGGETEPKIKPAGPPQWDAIPE